MDWTTITDPSGFKTRWSAETAGRYRAAGYWRDHTLVDTARKQVAEDPDKALLIDGDNHITRRQVWDQSLRLAGYFRDLGLKQGDVISFQLPNWWEAIVIALATRIMGLVINPIPPIYREAEVGYMLADCRSKVLFIPENFRKHDYAAMMDKLRSDLPELRQVVVLRGSGGGTVSYADLLESAPVAETEFPRIDPRSVMMVMYTSGTTGRAKGVMHSHYTFDYRVRSMAEAWSISSADCVFMPSPLTHITGNFWSVDMPWVSGCTSVLMDIWNPKDGVDTIARHGCTVSGGATPFLQQLIEMARERPDALSTLRLFFCGGTTVAPEIIRAASRLLPHGTFFRTYGSTEVAAITVGMPPLDKLYLGAESDGGVTPPSEVMIVDAETSEPLPHGMEGEILARGPEQFVGYTRLTDNDGNFDAQGYFRMGDLGRWREDNYIEITGRKKDLIIRSGENLSPKEVEDVLANHPAVAEIAIVAMPSIKTGEKGCAFIILRPGHSLDAAEIQAFLSRAGLARQKFPEYLVFVDDLPRVPSGKVRKDVLRKQAKEIAERSPAAAA